MFKSLETSSKIILAFLVAVVLYFGAQGARFVVHAATGKCQEDMSCWNCETMGDRTCGDVRVSLYNTTSDNQWVEIYDAHNRQVFLGRIDSVDDRR